MDKIMHGNTKKPTFTSHSEKLRDIMERNSKHFKIENFLAIKKKNLKDEEWNEKQIKREQNTREKLKSETNKERYDRNKMMMQVFFKFNLKLESYGINRDANT